LSENSIVGPRASDFPSGKDGEAGVLEQYVDTAGRNPGGKQAARSQIEFFDTALRHKIWDLACHGNGKAQENCVRNLTWESQCLKTSPTDY